MTDGTSYVYMLADPRLPHLARYVGKTSKTVEQRLREHVHDARKPTDQTRCARWLRELEHDGLTPVVTILDVVPTADEDEAERRWIADHRAAGYDLLNATSGGDGLHDPSPDVIERIRQAALAQWATPEARAALSEAMRRSHEAKRARGDTEAERAQRSAAQRALWADPEHATRQRAALAAGQAARVLPDHCPQGHLFDTTNTGTGVRGSRYCKTCLREANHRSYLRRTGRLDPVQVATSCRRGHPYDQENTGRSASGNRFCRTCRRENAARVRERKRAAPDR